MRLIFLLCALLISSCTGSHQYPQLGHEEPAKKRIALTFDDGPRGAGPRFSGDERAEVLIKALSSSTGQPAAFFIKTENFKRPGGRQRIHRYAQAGHIIANHTHSHNWLSRTDTNAYIADIDFAENALTGFDNRRPWFRFPYLDEGRELNKRNNVREALKSRGLFNAYVTVDNYDWYVERKWQEAVEAGKSVDLVALQGVYVDMLVSAVEFYDQVAVDTLGRSPVHVLLLHENDVAALFVDDLVLALKNSGWQIISPDVAYDDPIAAVLPTTLKTGQGQVAALAIDAGRDPRTLDHWVIDEAAIDERILERKVFGD